MIAGSYTDVVGIIQSPQKEVVLQRIFRNFLSDQSGATAIEYGLIAAGIALAIIAVVNGLGSNLNDKFTSINTSLK
jgi:pilus assembly protein Flp/PilA